MLLLTSDGERRRQLCEQALNERVSVGLRRRTLHLAFAAPVERPFPCRALAIPALSYAAIAQRELNEGELLETSVLSQAIEASTTILQGDSFLLTISTLEGK